MIRVGVFLAVAIFAIDVCAASKGIQITTRDGQQVGHYENSYALLIGVSDYKAGWPDLQAVPSELNDVKSVLEKKGFAVTQVIDPQGRQLQNAFESFVDSYGYNKGNRLLFYFSGHGYTRDNGNKGYLVPVDAPDPRRDERGFLRKAYAMIDLLAMARKIEANHALFLFDSCFSGTIFRTKSLPDTPPLISRLTSQPVRQFITAGDAGETVPAKSVFTPAFIEAIEHGTGDLNKDDYVTGSELGMHLQSVVSNSVRQTPQYGKITDFDLSRGDFVFLATLTQPRNLPVLPGNSEFSLDDIKKKAESEVAATRAEEEARQAWEAQLSQMRDAFNQVRGIDKDGASADTRIAAWERFLGAFKEDNPYSTADESMRTEGQSRIEQLERERELANEQLASTVLMPSPGSRPGSTFKDCDVCPEMVVIPAGTFRMGDLSGGGDEDEKPVHEVSIGNFALGKYEVKVGEFKKFVDRTSYRTDAEKNAGGKAGCYTFDGSKWDWRDDKSWRDPGFSQTDSHPVTCVSWRDATAYVEWLSGLSGKSYRLPSEAEWEYAARAVSRTTYHFGTVIADLCRYGNVADLTPLSTGSSWKTPASCRDGFGDSTAPVGSFVGNGFGLHDVHGNVWEWVEDCWHDNYRGAPSNGSAWTSGSCGSRVLRGGSWTDRPGLLRSATRTWYNPGYRDGSNGFRLAQDL